MASGRESHIEDLPPELKEQVASAGSVSAEWEQSLRVWAQRELARGHQKLLDDATPAFEKIMIECALQHTSGRRMEAAELLGWGRNTLTRKIKELGIFSSSVDEDDE